LVAIFELDAHILKVGHSLLQDRGHAATKIDSSKSPEADIVPDRLITMAEEVQTPPIRDILEVFPDPDNGLTLMKNVSIPLKASKLPVRANAYIPLLSSSAPSASSPAAAQQPRYPVLVTYGPYGKDIPYASFHPGSFAEVNPEHRSKYSAWETPDPVYWCRQGYAVVRADERGTGQSPGLLDAMSRGTSECFFDVVEWAADQPWSNGKVGLLGISYYAGTTSHKPPFLLGSA